MTAATSQLSHVYPVGSRVNEAGHLEIGGCDAIELAREFGTPAYVVAEDDLRLRARSFVDALAGRHRDFDGPGGLEVRVLGGRGPRCDRPARWRAPPRPDRPAFPHRLAAARARAVPRGDPRDRSARRVSGVQPRRRARRRVHRLTPAAP